MPSSEVVPATSQDADEREPHRELVTDHLGGRAHASEQGILRARGPAAERDAVHADRHDREQQQDAGVYVADRPHAAARRAERDDRIDGKCRQERDERREPVDERIGRPRRQIFFQDELCRVCGRLQQPPRSHAIRSRPQLHPGEDLALGEHRVRERRDDDEEQDRRLDRHENPSRHHEIASRNAAMRSSCAYVPLPERSRQGDASPSPDAP